MGREALVCRIGAFAFTTTPSFAAINITWWHGMGGRNGEVINEVAQKFNAAQAECALNPVSKGTYEEALALDGLAYAKAPSYMMQTSRN